MKRYVERDGKFYARVTYTDGSGKERQVWRRAENKSDAKELAKELERQLKSGTESFEHKGNLDEYLDRWLENRKHQLEHKLRKGEKFKNEHNLVFTSETGTIISIRNLQSMHFKPLLVKAELPDIRLYDLRHSCATLLLAAGENPKVVSERVGHASIVLTLDTYSHCLPNMQRSATERLEKILGK